MHLPNASPKQFSTKHQTFFWLDNSRLKTKESKYPLNKYPCHLFSKFFFEGGRGLKVDFKSFASGCLLTNTLTSVTFKLVFSHHECFQNCSQSTHNYTLSVQHNLPLGYDSVTVTPCSLTTTMMPSVGTNSLSMMESSGLDYKCGCGHYLGHFYHLQHSSLTQNMRKTGH